MQGNDNNKKYCEYCTLRRDSAGWKIRTVIGLLYGSLQGTVALPVLLDITMSTVRTTNNFFQKTL